MPIILSPAGAGESSFGKVNHHQLAHALLQERPSRVTQCHRIKLAISLADAKTRSLAGFNFVQDTIIDMLERRIDDPGETITIFADNVDARLNPRSLSGGEEACCFGAEPGIGLVQRVKQQQIA